MKSIKETLERIAYYGKEKIFLEIKFHLKFFVLNRMSGLNNMLFSMKGSIFRKLK
jgi:hypothetical protein